MVSILQVREKSITGFQEVWVIMAMINIGSMGMFMFDSLVDVAVGVFAIVKNFMTVMIVMMMFIAAVIQIISTNFLR